MVLDLYALSARLRERFPNCQQRWQFHHPGIDALLEYLELELMLLVGDGDESPGGTAILRRYGRYALLHLCLPDCYSSYDELASEVQEIVESLHWRFLDQLQADIEALSITTEEDLRFVHEARAMFAGEPCSCHRDEYR